ncbi:hypothetical protein SFB2_034G1 [Candidatus Arthromitus sp. SFB-2]|nr:hypothetical protein SFB2_034G1 [Candidatus Arthromitus sp. SFB-2]
MRTCEFCKSIISDDLKVCDNCISKVNGLREILGKNKEESLLEDQEIKEKTRIDKEESKKFKRELSMLAFIIFRTCYLYILGIFSKEVLHGREYDV